MRATAAAASLWDGMHERSAVHGVRTALAWGLHRACYDYPLRLAGRSAFGGENVLDEEWDVLLVLDGARVDTMRAVAADRDWIGAVESVRSVGGRSSTWLRETFVPRRDRLSTVAYITANPNTRWLFDETELSREDFGAVDEVWTHAWDDDVGTVRPRAVSDRVIAARRESAADRVIGHYMQPHFPSIPDPIGSEISLEDLTWENSAWNQLRRGRVSRARVLESFRANLEHVLDDVELVVDNVDGMVAVTADHGNAAGEWGYFGHNDWPVDAIRNVPWFQVEASDSRTYTPPVDAETSHRPVTDAEVERRLELLGYKN